MTEFPIPDLSNSLTGHLALVSDIHASGGISESIPFDITQPEQINRVLGKTEATLGLVDLLVKSAGIPDAQRAHKMSDDLVDRVFFTNLIGPWKLSCEVARRRIAAEWARDMINVNAIAAWAFASEMMDGMLERTGDITKPSSQTSR